MSKVTAFTLSTLRNEEILGMSLEIAEKLKNVKSVADSTQGKAFLDAIPAYAPVSLEDEGDEEFKIVRSKRFSIKPMSVEEAILQMNLLGHEFFVFRNMDEEDAISVVYHRKQGGYGLICDEAE